MGRDDDDHKLLDQMSARSVDRLSAKDRLWYMSSAICCTLLPLHLYINVLDLELASSQLILAVGCCGASVIGLFRFYHEAAKMKKHALHDEVRISARSKSGKTHMQEDNSAINLKAVYYSLFFNNAIYLFAMAFFGFYFLRGQSLEVNYVTSLLITMAIMFFANQEL